MEEDRESTRYWCHECNRPVVPILEVETIKCSSCNGGFVEEMESIRNDHHHHDHPDPDRDGALSLWAPILLGMMNNPRRRRRNTHVDFDDDEEHHDFRDRYRHYHLDRDLDPVTRRRQRSSAAILRLLHNVQTADISNGSNGNPEQQQQRERVILINPFNQTIIIQGSNGGTPSETRPIGSLGDYLSGPGLELLLQQLAENDPNRYGTPPAKKEAIDNMPTVTIDQHSIQCSVCLDDFEVGIEAKEMPCKHRFHPKCILPWLELHSSCPVCRFELPSDESKPDQEPSSRGSIELEDVGNGENGDGRNTRRFSVSLPWPFSSIFSSTTGPQTGSSMTSGSGSSSGSGPGPGAHEQHSEEDDR